MDNEKHVAALQQIRDVLGQTINSPVRCAALDAAIAALSRPAGGEWVMVPREPTPGMSAAGFVVSEPDHDPAGVYRAMLAAAPTLNGGDQHPDDIAVDQFAEAMKLKLAEARAKGRDGWQDKDDCPQQRLSDMLRAHVAKGDPRDVANFCMFLHQRGEGILPHVGEWVMVPKHMYVSPDAWEAAQFAFGGPGSSADEPFYDCTLWVGEIENDDGSKTHGLHVSCDECPEEGSITLSEFPAAPTPHAGDQCPDEKLIEVIQDEDAAMAISREVEDG